ncbi:hypothetical protein Ahy_A10g050767 [Arachis hypogaea]|uniref:Uncharacterized protein n=1 Tax=Arachis hypogaea TaxID=3818 RepID=A0A445BAE7_ARAHY|nr:hypothetical protein Ahy_A10g050767 [Arachis hypogaea]
MVTKAIVIVFKNMSQEKKDIVEEMRFEYHGCLKILHGKIYITPGKVAAALGISHGGNCFPKKVDYRKLNDKDKAIFDSLKCVMLVTLTKSVLNMSVEGEENQQKFHKTFVVFVQKYFLLRTTVSMASAVHKPPIFCVDNIQHFLRNGIENKRKGKTQSVEGCVFVLMLIYFHETKFPRLDGLDVPPAPWVAYWTKKMMLDQISEEATDTMIICF